METNFCYGCNAFIPRSSFKLDTNRVEGVKSRCRNCVAKTAREVYARDRDKLLDYNKQYRLRISKSKGNKDYSSAYQD